MVNFSILTGAEARRFLKENGEEVEMIDALVLECLRVAKELLELEPMTRYVCKRLGKDYTVPGLFTTNAHLKVFQEEGRVLESERGRYSLAS